MPHISVPFRSGMDVGLILERSLIVFSCQDLTLFSVHYKKKRFSLKHFLTYFDVLNVMNYMFQSIQFQCQCGTQFCLLGEFTTVSNHGSSSMKSERHLCWFMSSPWLTVPDSSYGMISNYLKEKGCGCFFYICMLVS